MVDSANIRQQVSGKVVRPVSAATMAGYHNLNGLERGVVVSTQENGHSISEIVIQFGFSCTIISRVCMNIRYPVKHQISDRGATGKRPWKNWTVNN